MGLLWKYGKFAYTGRRFYGSDDLGNTGRAERIVASRSAAALDDRRRAAS